MRERGKGGPLGTVTFTYELTVDKKGVVEHVEGGMGAPKDGKQVSAGQEGKLTVSDSESSEEDYGAPEGPALPTLTDRLFSSGLLRAHG
jgi:hypothetical protein